MARYYIGAQSMVVLMAQRVEGVSAQKLQHQMNYNAISIATIDRKMVAKWRQRRNDMAKYLHIKQRHFHAHGDGRDCGR